MIEYYAQRMANCSTPTRTFFSIIHHNSYPNPNLNSNPTIILSLYYSPDFNPNSNPDPNLM